MSSSIQKNIRQAEKYIKIREFSKAEVIYKEILKKFPKNSKAILALNTLKTLHKNKSAGEYKKVKIQELYKHYNRNEFTFVLQKAHELSKLYTKEIDIYNIQGAANAAMNNFQKAIGYYLKITKINPNSETAFFNIAVMYDSLNLPEDAIENYYKAIKNQPIYADAYNNMGSAYIKINKPDKAMEAYNKVIQLVPNHAYAHNNIGNIYMTEQSFDKAIKAFKMAIFFNPNYADAYNSLGEAYLNMKNITEAHKAFEKVLIINPNHIKGLLNMGSLHELNAEHKKSIQLYSKAYLNDPENDSILALKITQQSYICDIDEIKKDNSKIKHAGTYRYIVRPFDSFAQDDEPIRHQLRAAKYTNKYFRENRHLRPSNLETRPKRIRLGYISSDFKEHAVSYLIAKVLETHNRDEFKLFGYSISSSKLDNMGKRIRKSFDVFQEVDKFSDKEIALIIQKNKIDILIDLNGHTINSRTGIFAYKPSKIQINFLGFPGTMGAEFIDYIIADNVVIPNKFNNFYSEKIIRLPHSYMPTDNTRVISNRPITREEMGLPTNSVVLCCFNNTYKISVDEFNIWMRILSKIENSVLWLKMENELAKKNIHIAAEKRGVDPSRIIFADFIKMEDHLARYTLADIFLDTFNFNGHTTAADALWAGTPLITKLGKSFAARVAGSLLTATGLTELITNTEKEYEALIIQLANNPLELEKIKEKLKKNSISNSLFDTEKYTFNLEKAYHKAYENYTKGNNPENITIKV
ncbi:tetratricopeptide repeat protein [Amylibacter sp.]|nr:tetratricopeptide repeat protein [Amylibacter sp.]